MLLFLHILHVTRTAPPSKWPFPWPQLLLPASGLEAARAPAPLVSLGVILRTAAEASVKGCSLTSPLPTAAASLARVLIPEHHLTNVLHAGLLHHPEPATAPHLWQALSIYYGSPSWDTVVRLIRCNANVTPIIRPFPISKVLYILEHDLRIGEVQYLRNELQNSLWTGMLSILLCINPEQHRSFCSTNSSTKWNDKLWII